MFTGIIKDVGRISDLQRRDGDVRLTVSADNIPWHDFAEGESIAVNGVCLTAVTISDRGFETDVSVETLNVSALQQLSIGSSVNLEPAIELGERLGGHLVSGHVDCIGTVVTLKTDARSIRMSVKIPQEYSRYIAKKGSVCVDGVSLTVNEVSGSEFDLNIIPHTAQSTIIAAYNIGTIVNIEVDMLARYLERLLVHDGAGLTLDFLKAHGYVE